MDLPHYAITLDGLELPVGELFHIGNPDQPIGAWMEALRAVRPDWCTDDNLKLLSTKDLSPASFCNRNIACHVTSHSDDVIIIRAYNHVMWQRWSYEMSRSVHFAHAHGLGPKQEATFENGVCFRYVTGRAVPWEKSRELTKREYKRSIAEEIARYHTRKLADDGISRGITRDPVFMRDDWIREKWEGAKNGSYSKIFLQNLPDAEYIIKEKRRILAALDTLGSQIRVCHNDPNPTNFIITNPSTCSVLLIDIDQICIEHPILDIDWFFVTGGGLLDTDFCAYPDESYIDEFLRHYLSMRKRLDGENSVTDNDIVLLRKQLSVAHLLTLLRLLICGIAISSGLSNNRPDSHHQTVMPSSVLDSWHRYQEKKKVIEALSIHD